MTVAVQKTQANRNEETPFQTAVPTVAVQKTQANRNVLAMRAPLALAERCHKRKKARKTGPFLTFWINWQDPEPEFGAQERHVIFDLSHSNRYIF